MSNHVVPNVLACNLNVIFCGTAPSHTSAREKAYYAFPQNRFWKTLDEIGLTPYQLRPDEYRRVLEFRIGLTDLCKVACGNDDELPKDALNAAALRAHIEKLQPRILAFTSKTAGKAFFRHSVDYSWQQSLIGATRICILPSTSPRARRYWSIEPWRELADAVRLFASDGTL